MISTKNIFNDLKKNKKTKTMDDSFIILKLRPGYSLSRFSIILYFIKTRMLQAHKALFNYFDK